MTDPMMEMKQAVVALHLEVPESVATDIRKRWNAVADEVKALREAASEEAATTDERTLTLTEVDVRELSVNFCEAGELVDSRVWDLIQRAIAEWDWADQGAEVER